MRKGYTKLRKDFTYKYRIKENMDLLPYRDYVLAKRHLPEKLGINPRTFEKYMYTKLTDPYEMPVGHLALLAGFFRCTMEDMLNFQPEIITPQSLASQQKRDLAEYLGLRK
jgi:hypothetical protein